eukprot:scaffold296599_cov15-Tisochrysis_lutea.AAC.1
MDQPPSCHFCIEKVEAAPYARYLGSLASLKPQRFSLAGPSDSAHSMHQVVSVRAVGLNFRDVLNVLGMYPGDPGDPGSDFAGVVESGPAFAPGTPVFGLATGCLASHVVSHGNTLAPLPPNLTFEVCKIRQRSAQSFYLALTKVFGQKISIEVCNTCQRTAT